MLNTMETYTSASQACSKLFPSLIYEYKEKIADAYFISDNIDYFILYSPPDEIE